MFSEVVLLYTHTNTHTIYTYIQHIIEIVVIPSSRPKYCL